MLSKYYVNDLLLLRTNNIIFSPFRESPLVVFTHNLGFTLISFNNAPLKLNALLLRHAYGSMDEIRQPIQKHYTQQGLREVRNAEMTPL
jgi:hypothetical protein